MGAPVPDNNDGAAGEQTVDKEPVSERNLVLRAWHKYKERRMPISELLALGKKYPSLKDIIGDMTAEKNPFEKLEESIEMAKATVAMMPLLELTLCMIPNEGQAEAEKELADTKRMLKEVIEETDELVKKANNLSSCILKASAEKDISFDCLLVDESSEDYIMKRLYPSRELAEEDDRKSLLRIERMINLCHAIKKMESLVSSSSSDDIQQLKVPTKKAKDALCDLIVSYQKGIHDRRYA